MAEVFAARGDSVLVMRGEDGLDEFTTAAPTRVWVVARRHGHARPWSTPPTSACPAPPPATCAAATRRSTPTVARRLLAGETGPVRDAVLLNAAAALAAHDRAVAGRCAPPHRRRAAGAS